MNVIYQVHYLRQKKKGYSQTTAGDFLTIDDAVWYENLMKQQGAKDIKIVVK
jgi:hypothetical protein